LRFKRPSLKEVNDHIQGQIDDYTANEGDDRRIWSAALGERRDLYVYLPPSFDPQQSYPLLIWLHQLGRDEQSFVDYLLEHFDRAIADGRLPPLIIAVPDGSLTGQPRAFSGGSFYLNTRAGRFEDFVMQDVWDFMLRNYPIRPEREAHALGGISMGGFGSVNLGIKYRDRIGVVAALMPPLNLRWQDCHGRALGKFDPDCWGWRDELRGGEVIGRFYGVFTVRARRLIEPLYDREPDVVWKLSRENPIEMLDLYDLRPGELAMYVGYGGRDGFNVGAQVESFLYRARQRGLCVSVTYDPTGRHDVRDVLKLLPGMFTLLSVQLAGYSSPPAQR